ncbi:MAG: hypothetical protein ACP5SD_08290 [Elusimicrobiales bacterium]
MINILLVSILFVFTSCYFNVKKYSEDPLISNALERIRVSDKKNLVSFLTKYPAYISYNFKKTDECVKIRLTPKNEILIPFSSSDSDIMTEAETVKGLYFYRTLTSYKISELFYELELLSSYAQFEYIFDHFKTEEIKKTGGKDPVFMKKTCAYILSPKTFEKVIYDETRKSDYSCGYPLNEISYYENYYNQLKSALTAVEGEAFYNLVYERYMEKVKRGELTREEAQKRYYYLLSEPTQEFYRNQRTEITDNIAAISKFKKFYSKELKKFQKKAEYKKELQTEYPECLNINF